MNRNNGGWTEEATFALISVWGSTQVQEGFDGTRRNAQTYGLITAKMEELGFNFNRGQIINKCKNLKKQYNQAKDDNNKSGNGPTDWPYFPEMDEIFGDRPASRPTRPVFDTSDNSSFDYLDLDGDNRTGDSFGSGNSDVHDTDSGSDKNDRRKENSNGPTTATDSSSDKNEKERKNEDRPAAAKRKKRTKLDETFVGLEKALRESSREHLEQQQKMQEEMFRWEAEREERNEQKAHERQLQLLQVISNMFRPANTPASTAQTQHCSNFTTLSPQPSSSSSRQPCSSFQHQYSFPSTAAMLPSLSSPLSLNSTPSLTRPSSFESQFNTRPTITPSSQHDTLRQHNNANPPTMSSPPPLPVNRTPASSSQSRINVHSTTSPSPQPCTQRRHNTTQDNRKKGIHQPWFQL